MDLWHSLEPRIRKHVTLLQWKHLHQSAQSGKFLPLNTYVISISQSECLVPDPHTIKMFPILRLQRSLFGLVLPETVQEFQLTANRTIGKASLVRKKVSCLRFNNIQTSYESSIK